MIITPITVVRVRITPPVGVPTLMGICPGFGSE